MMTRRLLRFLIASEVLIFRGREDEAAETTELNLGTTNALNEAGSIRPRPEPKVAMVWLHLQRISEREHFWGAWVSLRLEDKHWESATVDQYESEPSSSRPNDSMIREKIKIK